MKHTLTSCFLLLGLCQPLAAAELVLQLELPQAELLLAPASPPQLQQEGVALLPETNLLTQMIAMTDRQEYEAALELAATELGAELALLEQGDPEGLLKARSAPGGFAPAPPDPISAAAFYVIGHVYLALQQYVPAEAAFKAALAGLPDYLRAHEALGLMYLQDERYEEARTHLVRAAALGLNTANLYGALGYINRQTGNHWGAIAAFEQAMMLEHDNPNWANGLLNAFGQSYQYESGLALTEHMLQSDADFPAVWLYRSQFALQAGEREAALSSLETAIRLGENSAGNLQVCATLHMELGSIARAVELLEAGVAQGMEFRFLDQALAWLIEREEWDYAQTLLDGMAASDRTLNDSDQSRLLTRQASLSLNADARQDARTALQRALELDPANADALMALAGIYREGRNFNQAELLYQRASAYELYRENALIALAQLAIDQDNFERALQLLREVVERNPARTDLDRNIESLESLALLQAGGN